MVAEDRGLVQALDGSRNEALPRTVIPLGIKRELDYVAIQDERNQVVFRNGRTDWRDLPVVTGSA